MVRVGTDQTRYPYLEVIRPGRHINPRLQSHVDVGAMMILDRDNKIGLAPEVITDCGVVALLCHGGDLTLRDRVNAVLSKQRFAGGQDLESRWAPSYLSRDRCTR